MRTEWLEGLLHAETIGVEDAINNVYRNEYDKGSEFLKGVTDYIQHATNRIKL